MYQDHLTKFVVLRPIKSKTAMEVSPTLLDIFCLLGPPNILQRNGGKLVAWKIGREEIRSRGKLVAGELSRWEISPLGILVAQELMVLNIWSKLQQNVHNTPIC